MLLRNLAETNAKLPVPYLRPRLKHALPKRCAGFLLKQPGNEGA